MLQFYCNNSAVVFLKSNCNACAITNISNLGSAKLHFERALKIATNVIDTNTIVKVIYFSGNSRTLQNLVKFTL